MIEITRQNIVDIVKSGETENLEFKTSFNDESLESVGAFANAHGGVILIGVNDAGNIIGVNLGKKSLEGIANTIQDCTDPRLQPSITKIQYEGKTIIAIQVSIATSAPVSIRGRYFKRVGRTNQRMSHEEIMQRFMANASKSWDMAIEHQATFKDLDPEQIANYIQLVRRSGRQPISETTSDLVFLRKLELINEENLPTRAAVLLFGITPNHYYPSAYLKVGRFKTPTMILDDKEFHGPLIGQLEGVMGWFRDRLETKFVITGKPQRDVIWEYPLDAIREVITNAIIHRDYTTNVDCQIKLYDDHLDVWNPGILSPLLTPEALLQEHVSILRNRKIAEAFFYAGLIEKWGSGTIRVAKELQLANMPPPKFTVEGFRFHASIYKQKIQRSSMDTAYKITNLSPRQEKLLGILEDHKLGLKAPELLSLLKEPIVQRTLSDDLMRLKKLGLIDNLGRGKHATWIKK